MFKIQLSGFTFRLPIPNMISPHTTRRLLTGILFWAGVVLAVPASAQVVINEVDADQDGTDAAEFVELYDGGTGNTALDGLVLVLFNGSDDASYLAFDLDGQSTNGSGYFVLCGNAANVANCDMDVAPDSNLIQNGADAVALLTGDATDFPNDTPVTTNNLLDAIVYDTNDSDDAGLLVLLNAAQPQVNEGGGGNSTIHSNSRCPNGSGGARNTDTYIQVAPTPGTENSCSPPQPDVFINEVDADQVGTDAAEFVELYDGGTGNTALDGLVLVLFNGSDDASYLAFDLDGQSTNGSGYFVLCGNAANVANCDMDVAPDSNLIQNGADAVALLTGDATDFPNDTPVTTNNLLDAIVYDTNDSDDAGLLVLLNAAQPQVNEAGGGDATVDSNGRCPDGSGGLRNTDTYNQGAPTPGVANTCSQPLPDVFINEVDADQVGTDAAEFVELYDGGTGNTALDGLVLVLFNGSDDASYLAFDLDGQTTNGSGHFVLCGDAANVANCDLDVSPNTNLIQNGADAVALLIGDATDFPNDTPVTTNNLMDALVYDTNDSDDAGLLVLLNAAQPQVNEAGGGDATVDSNGRCPDGSGGLRNTDTYAQGGPTPGANNNCPAVPTTLVINEIDYDQSGTDAGEFIEIRNVGGDPVNLSGFSLVLVNGANGGATTYNTFNLPGVALAGGDYFVVCGNSATVFDCDLDVSPDTNMIQNGSPDAVAIFKDAAIVDTVSYEGSVPGYTETDGNGLFDSSSSFVGISRTPDGSDTNVNNVDFSQRCITPGSANTTDNENCTEPGPPVLVINEIDYDQPSGDTAEFVEILNTGNSAADLSTVDLVLINGTGGGAAVYDTIALPAVSLGPDEYYVVCSSTATVANCNFEGISSIQNGSPDAVALVTGAVIIDTVSYEGDTGTPYTEGSGSGLQDSGSSDQDFFSISRFPNGVDTGQNNVDLLNSCITPGSSNTSLTNACSANGPVLEIFEIQGTGSASPFTGQGLVTQDNIVTAVGTDGFAMQTPDARDDGDLDTSNGIYVFTGSPPTVAVGDQVDVAGSVVEFFGFTEFSFGSLVTIDSSGNAPPAATIFDASVPSPDPLAPSCAIEFECYEGMLVEITGGSVTSANQNFGTDDPIAEVHITAATERTFRETGIEFVGLPGLPEWDGNPELFELDPDRLGLPNEIIAGGSHFDATGVIGFEFGGYELWPSSLTIYPTTLPQAVRVREEAEMTVGALNLFRLFDDIDDAPIPRFDPDTNTLYPPDTNDTVVSTAEYQRRLTKFSGYIRNVLMAPDILAVSEVESLVVLQDLAALINTDDNTLNYTPYLEEGNDIGGIDVGFLVLDTVVVGSVTQLGRWEVLAFDGSLLNDRPPLLLEGKQVADGSDFPIAVIAIHGRSLSRIDDATSGERVRAKRLAQAQYVAAQVQILQDADPDLNLVVAGDFNSFEFTDAYVDVTGQMKGDFVAADNLVCTERAPDCDFDPINPDLINQVLMIPEGERYSFIFGGNAQTLDHALTSSGLDELVRDLSYGRGNSDVISELINVENTVLRSSDHDGLVLFLAKDSDGDGVTDDLDVCPGTVIPEGAAMTRLGVNRWSLYDDDRIFDTTPPKGVGPQASFGIFDTAGCSCEQIVEEQQLGKGHLKFGCSLGVMQNWVDLVSQP